jgi:hypothetical protein
MKRPLILLDATSRPDLFLWNRPVDEQLLATWISNHGWRVPKDLFELWQVTGGGDFFESETILFPMSDSESEGVEKLNEALQGAGMPRDYLVFHTGLGGLTAIRMSDQVYVQLDRARFQETSQYASLDDWYSRLMRGEYAARYGV